MGVVLVCGDAIAGRSIVRNQLRTFDVRRTTGFDVEPDRSMPVCCIVAAMVEFTAADLAQLENLRERFPAAPVVLVTRLTAATIRSLACRPTLIEHLTALEDVASELADRVLPLISGHFLERAADALLNRLDPPGVVGAFISLLWGSPRPPTLVKSAARRIGVSRTTLRGYWHGLGLRSPPSEFLDWALLGRAVPHRAQGASWEQAAHRLRIGRRRLHRVAMRRVGTSSNAIELEDPSWVEAHFQEWLEATWPK